MCGIDNFKTVLICFSVAIIKHWTKALWGKRGISGWQAAVHHRGKPREELKAGTWRQELKQRPWPVRGQPSSTQEECIHQGTDSALPSGLDYPCFYNWKNEKWAFLYLPAYGILLQQPTLTKIQGNNYQRALKPRNKPSKGLVDTHPKHHITMMRSWGAGSAAEQAWWPELSPRTYIRVEKSWLHIVLLPTYTHRGRHALRHPQTPS